MDATNNKTITGVFVALLLGSMFVGTLTAAADIPNPTAGVTAVAVDALNIKTSYALNGVTEASSTWRVSASDAFTGGNLTYNGHYDLTVYNLSTSVNNGYGYAGATSTVFLCEPGYNVAISQATLYSPLNSATTKNATFVNVLLNATGDWYVNTTSCANGGTTLTQTLSGFIVYPVADLTVTVSPASVVFGTAQTAVTITVGGLATGETAVFSGAPFAIPSVSSASPSTTVFTSATEAGAFTFAASVNSTGGPEPERTGTGTFTVSPGPLTVTGVVTTPKAGFLGEGTWNITQPNGADVLGGHKPALTGGACGCWFNLSANTSVGNYFVNASTIPSGAATVSFYSGTQGVTTSNALLTGLTWYFQPTTGNFSIWYNSTSNPWPTGAINFVLDINSVQATATDKPEWHTAWSFTPATPAALNLDVKGCWASVDPVLFTCGQSTPAVPASVSIANMTVQNAASANGPPGGYTLELTLTGATQAAHPVTAVAPTLLAGFDVTNTANITISGDALFLQPQASWSYSGAGSGIVTVKGIIPTKVNGHLTITAHDNNNTATATLPIVEGGLVTVSPSQLVVEQNTTVTIHVEDQNTNPIPDALVQMFEQDTTANSASELTGYAAVVGNGSAGYGLHGDYTMVLNPTKVGKYVVWVTLGHGTAGPSGTRYAYANFSVVPAHDLAVTVTPTSTWGSLPTQFAVNASIPSLGTSLGTGEQIYLVNATQWADFLANGTLGTGLYPTAAVSTGLIGAPTVSGGGVAAYYFNLSLQPDTYYVYVCGNSTGTGGVATNCGGAKHDNSQNLPTVTVNPYVATFSPAAVASNPQIQNNTAVMVTVTGAAGVPVNGTLVASDADSVGRLTCYVYTGNCSNSLGAAIGANASGIAIVNGVGSFVTTGSATIGAIHWKFQPNNQTTNANYVVGGFSSLVSGTFDVVGPNVIVSPDRVPVGTPTTVSVTVKTLTGEALSGIWVTMCGTPIIGQAPPTGVSGQCTGGVRTDASGLAQVGFVPQSNGLITLLVNNVTTPTTITVYSGLQITWTPSSPAVNDTVTLTVAQIGQLTGGVSGVTVTVEKNGATVSGFPQTTGTNGQVVLPSVSAGTYNISAVKAGFQNASASFTVSPSTAPPAKAPKFSLQNLVAPSSGTVGQPLSASAEILNTGDADGTATGLLLVNGVVRGSQSVPVAAGGKETVGFDFTPTIAGTFKVTVKLATGETLAEKTVTITAPTTTTVSPTQTTTTTTTTTTTQTTPTGQTTTSPTATTPTPKVPGFEIVALIGALAVALLVLRRRN